MIEFNNLKYRPDSEGLWWFGENEFDPAMVKIFKGELKICILGVEEDLSLDNFRTICKWLSNDERDRQLFEMGARAQMEKTKGGSCGHPIVTWREFNFGALGIKENKEG